MVSLLLSCGDGDKIPVPKKRARAPQAPASQKRRKALFDQYMEREALASAIGKENLPDKDSGTGRT
ncbi:MAG: hypothetical protein GY729_04915 [Desulfobacteraceae bacterium]|nr:hypothetical protein [Desulfobacteraceae bacterium]